MHSSFCNYKLQHYNYGVLVYSTAVSPCFRFPRKVLFVVRASAWEHGYAKLIALRASRVHEAFSDTFAYVTSHKSIGFENAMGRTADRENKIEVFFVSVFFLWTHALPYQH